MTPDEIDAFRVLVRLKTGHELGVQYQLLLRHVSSLT